MTPTEASHPLTHGDRRGSYAVVLAVTAIGIIGFAAITVDLGVLHLAHGETRTAVDAAALAAASHVDGTATGVGDALASAGAVAAANRVRGEPVELEPSDIELGDWDADERVFRPSTDPASIDAVRVSHLVPGIPTPFARTAFGIASGAVASSGIAWRGPAEPEAWTSCFLPIAIPTCVADGFEAGTPPVGSLRFANDSADDAAWAWPGGTVNAHGVSVALGEVANGTCVKGDTRVEHGERVALQNGIAASDLKTVKGILLGSTSEWDEALWGPRPAKDPNSVFSDVQYARIGVLQGAIPVFDPGGACPQVKFNQERPVERLVWGVVFDVFAGPGAHQGMQVMFDVGHPIPDPGGGGSGEGNAVARPPSQLVE